MLTVVLSAYKEGSIMKRIVCLVLVIAFMVALCACAGASTASGSPNQKKEFDPEVFEDFSKIEFDLDGDGKEDTAEFIISDDENEEALIKITLGSGEELTYKIGTYIYGIEKLVLADFNNDGIIEIVISYDMASADYITECFNTELLKNSDNKEKISVYGYPNEIDKDGNIVIAGYVNILGTWAGTKPYKFDMDKLKFIAQSEYWTINYDDDSFMLEAKKDIPAFALNDGEYVDEYISAGTKLAMIKTDELTEVYVKAQDGTEYKIDIQRVKDSEDDYGWTYINGEPEENWFVELRYAG